MNKVIFILLILSCSPAVAQRNTAIIPVSVTIVNYEDVDTSLFAFDYDTWKMQCCKQVAHGTTTNLHYNCETLIDQGALDNCSEWYELNRE